MTSHSLPNGKRYSAKPEDVCLWFYSKSGKGDERIPSNMKIERFSNSLSRVTFKEHCYGMGWLDYYFFQKKVFLSGHNGKVSLYDTRQGDLLNLPISVKEFTKMLDSFGIAHQ